METAPFLFERPINTRAQNHRKLPVSYAIVNEIERQVRLLLLLLFVLLLNIN